MTLIKTQGKATLYREGHYFGRTSPIVEWIVKVGDRTIIRCRTRYEALEWLNIYAN